MPAIILRALASLVLLTGAVHAAHAASAGHIRSVREHSEIAINADSTYTHSFDTIWRAVDPAGAQSLGQQYLSYHTGRQKLELLVAETIPARGAPVKVPAADIKVQDGILGGVSFPDKKLLQITFPKLAAGDAIHLRFRLVQQKLDLPGGMSQVILFRRDVIRDDTVLTLRHPAALALELRQHDIKLVQDTTAGGERIRRWELRSSVAVEPEPDAVNSWQTTPHLMLSTFGSWKAIADSYQRGMAGKAAVTPEVRALAEQIVAGTVLPRQATARIYDWVRRNIRYIASYVGDGGFVPNDAATILRKRYGDCKDHATLLEALLAARGIASSQVLIAADRDNYVLPTIPVMLFNHVINYVPSMNLFLDATDSAMPFGLLPEVDSDKQVLVTRDFSALLRTPLPSGEDLRVERRVRIALAADGSAVRTSEITGYGRSAVLVRQFLGGVGPGRERDWVQKALTSAGLEGDGKLELISSPRQDAQGFRLTEHIRNYVSQPEAGVLSFTPGVGGPVGLAAIVNRFTAATRMADARCDGFDLLDVIEIAMPAAMEVLYLPKDVSLKEGPVSFEARYERSGNTYRLTRTANSRAGKAWCSPQEYQAMRPAMNLINKALGARLVYVTKE